MKLPLIILSLFFTMPTVHSEVKTSAKNFVGPCSYEQKVLRSSDFVNEGFKVTETLVCGADQFINKKRFSPAYCEAAINCRTTVFSKNDGVDKLKLVDQVLNSAIAKDLVKNAIEKNSDKMESLEALKAFAKAKLNIQTKDNKICSGAELPKDLPGCNYSLLSQTFEDHQASCIADNSKGCFKNDETIKAQALSFANFKKSAKKSETSIASDYLIYRAGKKADYQISKDSELEIKLATLVTSEAFKKSNSAKKAELFLAASEEDPVIGFDLLSTSKKLPASTRLAPYKNLVSLYEKHRGDKKAFIKSFNQYRSARASEILNVRSEACNKSANVKWLCKEMTAINENKILDRLPVDIADKFSSELDDQEIRNTARNRSGDIVSNQNFKILVDAKTCVSYKLPRPPITRNSPEDLSRSDINLDKFGDLDDTIFSNLSFDKSALTSLDWMDKIKVGPETSSPTAEDTAKPGDFGASNIAPVVNNVNTPTAANAISPQSNVNSGFAEYKPTDYNPSSFNNPDTNSSPLASDDDNKNSKKGSLVLPPADERINELSKKLAIAEDKVEKMRVSNEEAENERVKQKKIEEEEQLIKDMKTQLADLKSQNAKKAAEKNEYAAAIAREKENARDRDDEPRDRPDYVSNNTKVENTQKKGSDIYDPYIRKEDQDIIDASNDNAKASRSSGSSSSNATPSVAVAANGEKSITLASGLVLISVDGMSAEKASETITNRILELNGGKFFIEEFGMVKEVLPSVVDGKIVLDDLGKPVYLKVVKGKIGDDKFAKIKSKDRAPASKSLTDVAALKRYDEEKAKIQRVEYLKLHSITNGILNKK